MAVQTLSTNRKSAPQTLAEIAQEKSIDKELDIDLDLDFDPTSPSLVSTAAAGHPFSLCWSREVRSILAGLDSERLRDRGGPWVLETPFDISQAQLCVLIPDSVRDGSSGLSTAGHYRDGLSTSSESSKEHLSAALGVTVDFPFLEASVTAKYDKQVKEDKNGVKASRNTSCRAGRVVLDQTPAFSQMALSILQSGRDGEERFRERYGDFYISGFVLGADAGACLSASIESMESKETVEVTIEVKTLLEDYSETSTEVNEVRTFSSSVSFSGYSTLDNMQPCSLTLSGGASWNDQRVLQQRAREYMEKVKGLQDRVQSIIREVGLVDGASLKLADCARLCRSGLVIELLLAPFARLNRYVESVGLRYVGDVPIENEE